MAPTPARLVVGLLMTFLWGLSAVAEETARQLRVETRLVQQAPPVADRPDAGGRDPLRVGWVVIRAWAFLTDTTAPVTPRLLGGR